MKSLGERGASPLDMCTKLLMLCWSNSTIRREVLLNRKSPVVSEGRGMTTAKEFADRLLVDENEKHAGVLAAMQWVYKELELCLFGL